MDELFAHGGWIAHLSYLLLVLSMMSRVTLWLRIGVIGSAIAGIVYAVAFIDDWNLAFWEAALLVVNVAQIVRFEWSERRTRFDAREDGLRAAMMAGLPRLHARALIDQGYWVQARAGETLIDEQEAVSHLFYLHGGRAQVLRDGREVGVCAPGQLIGDATALSGHPATATVRVGEPSTLWCVAAPQLRRYLDTHPGLRPVLERHINHALRSKLDAANARLAAG